MSSRIRVTALFVTDSIYTLYPTLLSVLILAPAAYGRFSLVYVLYALGATLGLSIVSEPWARGGRQSAADVDSAYTAMSALVSLMTVLLCLGSGMLWTHDLLFGIVAGLAGGFNVLRSVLRYRSVALGTYSRVLVSDLLAVAAAPIVYVLVHRFSGLEGSIEVFLAWGVGAVLAVPLLWRSAAWQRGSFALWRSRYGAAGWILVRDSALAQVNSVATPYILAPVLGIASFGTYRAVGNTNVPLRLLTTGIRPFIARRPREFWSSSSAILSAGGIGVVGALGAYWVLRAIGHWDITLGTLSSLVPYALLVSLFVALAGFRNYMNALCRVFVGGRVLLRARAVTVVVAIVAPITGALLFGLTGAMWGLVIDNLVGAALWCWALVRRPEVPTTRSEPTS